MDDIIGTWIGAVAGALYIADPGAAAQGRRANGAAGAPSWVPEPPAAHLDRPLDGAPRARRAAHPDRSVPARSVGATAAPWRVRGSRRLIGRVDAVLLSHAHPRPFRPAVACRAGRRSADDRARGSGQGRRGAWAFGPGSSPRDDRTDDRRRAASAAVPAHHGRLAALPIGRRARLPRGGHAQRLLRRRHVAPSPGLRALAGRVDVALLPIGSWGPHSAPWHLGPRGAARLADIDRGAGRRPHPLGHALPGRTWPGCGEDRRIGRRSGSGTACATLAPATELRSPRPGRGRPSSRRSTDAGSISRGRSRARPSVWTSVVGVLWTAGMLPRRPAW